MRLPTCSGACCVDGEADEYECADCARRVVCANGNCIVFVCMYDIKFNADGDFARVLAADAGRCGRSEEVERDDDCRPPVWPLLVCVLSFHCVSRSRCW